MGILDQISFLEEFLRSQMVLFEWMQDPCRALGAPFLPGMLAQAPVSHDTVRKVMLLADPEKFANMCQKLTAGLALKFEDRVIAADGQAVKASRSTGENGGAAYMIMNFYDTVGRVCIGQKLIDRKTNEITAGPEILKNLDVRGQLLRQMLLAVRPVSLKK